MKGKLVRRNVLSTVILVITLLMSTSLVSANVAGSSPTLKPILGPRVDPRPIPHTSVIGPVWIYNNIIVPNLPAQSSQAAAVAKRDGVDSSDPGVLKTVSNIAVGITLGYPNAVAPSTCADFNENGKWSSRLWALGKWQGDVWTDAFAGWGPFAVDDGFYQAKNVTFSHENVIGPGANYSDWGPTSMTAADGSNTSGNHAAKVASNQPYIAGFAGPVIHAAPGAQVKVVVRYLIYNHGVDFYDYASLAVIPDILQEGGQYVGGFTRGQWAVMENTVTAGASGQLQIMLQGQSPSSANSNIYFDDVEIFIDGIPMAKNSCEG